MSDNGEAGMLLAGAATTGFIMNILGAMAAHGEVGNPDGSLGGNALLGALNQVGVTAGTLAGALLLTCCCCGQADAAFMTAVGYAPVAAAGVVGSLVVNFLVTEDKTLNLALNILAPIPLMLAACSAYCLLQRCQRPTYSKQAVMNPDLQDVLVHDELKPWHPQRR